jgi:hypothetical protein
VPPPPATAPAAAAPAPVGVAVAAPAAPSIATPHPTPTAPLAPATPSVEAREASVRRVIADYARAVEQQDIALYRSVKPDLSSDDEKKLREAFKAVSSQQVGITVDSVEIDGDEASVKVTRQDTVNGRAQPTRRQLFRLARAGGSWTLVSMGPLK